MANKLETTDNSKEYWFSKLEYLAKSGNSQYSPLVFEVMDKLGITKLPKEFWLARFGYLAKYDNTNNLQFVNDMINRSKSLNYLKKNIKLYIIARCLIFCSIFVLFFVIV